MEGTRELKHAGMERGPRGGSVGTGTVDDALDFENLARGVHHRYEAILDFDPGAVRRPNGVFDRGAAALEDRVSNVLGHALEVATRNEIGESEAATREKPMRVIAGDVAASGADEVHRPTVIGLPPVEEAAEVSNQAPQRGVAVDALDEGRVGGRRSEIHDV